MRKYMLVFVIALGISISPILMKEFNLESKESIIFFPIHPSISYTKAITELTLLDHTEDNSHSVNWKISSNLEQEAYLRQDIGFLFKNGRLAGKLGPWKQETKEISQEQIIKSKESGVYDAISFHYSEIHNKEEDIFSSQKMSSDRLYIIDSSFSPLASFRTAHTKVELEWKTVLDRVFKSRNEQNLLKALKVHGVDRNNYVPLLLTELPQYEQKPIPGYNRKNSDIIIGNLWEGLYKNYFQGIKKADGTVIAPDYSTIPLIMISKKKPELLIFTETKDGESIMLRQLLPKNR